MPLANIARPPETEADTRQFDFSHYQDHLEIIQATNRTMAQQLPVLPIHPVDDKDDGWKRMHQAMHDGMNRALALSSGQDLTGEMDAGWYNSNYNEHLAARTKLGI